MLEGLVTWVLNTYIGEYVENLNTDHLTIGLFQGNVELENLQLKKDALKNLGLPIEVKSGFIGKVQLQVPVRRLKSEKWVITLDKLYLIAGPINKNTYDEAKEKKHELERKKARLKAMEDDFQFHRDLAKQNGETLTGKADSWWSYGTSFFTNIMENLQLNVMDVHVRYEDDQTIPHQTFACGIVINSISVQSADANWVPGFVSHSASDVVYKLVDLQGFSIYWDTGVRLVGSCSRIELEEFLTGRRNSHTSTSAAPMNDTKGHVVSCHDYLLEPVSTQVRVRRNTSALPLRNIATPRFLVDITLDRFSVSLGDVQYRGVTALLKEIERHDRGCKFRRFRPPAVQASITAKDWWRYAIESTVYCIHERNLRRTKKYMCDRVRNIIKYVTAYEEYLSVGQKYLNRTFKDVLEYCEQEWTFDELSILRSIITDRLLDAERQAARNRAAAAALEQTTTTAQTAVSPTAGGVQPEGLIQRWFPGWAGWYGYGYTASTESASDGSTSSEVDDLSVSVLENGEIIEGNQIGAIMVGQLENHVSISAVSQSVSEPALKRRRTELEQEIMDTLTDSVENSTLLKQDMVFAQLNFCLQNSSFRLLTSERIATDVSEQSCLQTMLASHFCLLELECSSVQMSFESRPRTSGFKFSISVQDLFLRDKMTPGSIVPTLVASFPREKSGSGPLFKPAGLVAESEGGLFDLIYEKKPLHCKRADYMLSIRTQPLDIVYNPLAIKHIKEFFTIKKSPDLHAIKTELNMAAAARSRYEALKKHTQAEVKHTIDAMLKTKDTTKAKRWMFDLDISAPQIRIPENFTNENSMLVVFDLGRLQFHNRKTIDQERTTKEQDQQIESQNAMQDEDDADDFVTPSSTPPNEGEEERGNEERKEKEFASDRCAPPQSNEDAPLDLSDAAIHDTIYETYDLSLSDLQVMIGRFRDGSWKTARNKGTSLLHVVDKFSISLEFERRLIYTTDPRCPKLTLHGTLPRLVLHVDEQKIVALKVCAALFLRPDAIVVSEQSSASSIDLPSLSPTEDQFIPLTNIQQSTSVATCHSTTTTSERRTRDQRSSPPTSSEVDTCNLILAHFSIGHVSLALQSRQRSIAELQVSRVRATLTKRSFETSIGFSVHSLLVVDAIQQFGADFELLVASHRNLCLDSHSGSILDSKPNSPADPQSPATPPQSPIMEQYVLNNTRTTPLNNWPSVQTTLQSLSGSATNTPGVDRGQESLMSASGNRSFVATSMSQDDEALIRVEIDIINTSGSYKIKDTRSNGGSDDELFYLANIEFNSLDIIANQQTIVELLTFFRQVFPRQSIAPGARSEVTAGKSIDTAHISSGGSDCLRRELTANFHRLNILLMRVEEIGTGEKRVLKPHKVATATLSEAKIQATLGQCINIKGSLCGFQLLDLTPGGSRHQQVLSVGIVPTSAFISTPDNNIGASARPRSLFDAPSSSDKAFTFNINRSVNEEDDDNMLHARHASKSSSHVFREDSRGEDTLLVLRVASVGYLHAPNLLRELSLCMTEFREYVLRISRSLKMAATELAMGLIGKTAGSSSESASGGLVGSISSWSLDAGSRGRHASDHLDVPGAATSIEDLSFDSLNSFSDKEVDKKKHISRQQQQQQQQQKFNFRLDAVLETPVILLPKTATSSDVLSLHLGKIIIHNNPLPFGADSAHDIQQYRSDVISIDVRDLSAYSLDLDKMESITPRHRKSEPDSFQTSAFHPGWFLRTRSGVPILHDTEVKLTIQKMFASAPGMFRGGENEREADEDEDVASSAEVEHIKFDGQVVGALKLVLTKQIYEQILKTVDNLTPSDDEKVNVNESVQKSSADLDGSINSSTFLHSQNLPSMPYIPFADKPSATAGAAAINDKPVIVRGCFQLPVLSIKMIAMLGESEHGLINVGLENFSVAVTANGWFKTLDIYLQTLVIHDLLQNEGSEHRELMVSRCNLQRSTDRSTLSDNRFLSSSCPTNIIDMPLPLMPPSLPSSFDVDQNVFVVNAQRSHGVAAAGCHRRRTKSICTAEYPCTPPPSPTATRTFTSSAAVQSLDPLVHLKVKLVDRKCPLYASKYNRTNRIISIDFNCLETTVNLETWVLVLEFLGVGGKVFDPEEFTLEAQNNLAAKKNSTASQTGIVEEQEVINTEVDITIQSLSLVLIKREYELARANASSFSSHVSLHDGNFELKGQLGCMLIVDSSPHGKLYRERFTTTGKKAVDFQFFKYGTPDPECLRPFDATIHISMSSVWYVHTQRFIQETLAFAQNFNQLQDLLGRSRAASAGKKITEHAFHNARVSVDIVAGAPVILIPQSSRTKDILVLDLGKLRVRNSFLYDGDEGTIRHAKEFEKQAHGRSNSLKSDGSGRSGTMGHAGVLNDAMHQSVYGSLDTDWRDPAINITEQRNTPVSNLALSSFLSAVGRSPVVATDLNTQLDSNGAKHKAGISSVSQEGAAFLARGNTNGTERRRSSSSSVDYRCLLEVTHIELLDMEVYSARWTGTGNDSIESDLVFPSYIVRREPGKILKQKCRLCLQMERNLDGDMSHGVPDFSIDGKLSSVCLTIDTQQYQLIRGLLSHNLGEQLEEFQRQLMLHIKNPKIQTVLTGQLYVGLVISVELDGVQVELCLAHADDLSRCPAVSLARFDFVCSRLIIESRSDGSKDIDLVSHEIKVHDTRYCDAPANVRPNVFSEILKPSSDRSQPDSLQLEVHCRTTKECARYTILLNNMRVLGVFDWLTAVADFLAINPEDPFKKDKDDAMLDQQRMQASSSNVYTSTNSGSIVTKRIPVGKMQAQLLELCLNVTDTELVVVENTAYKDTNAIILKGTSVLVYRESSERPLSCSLQSLEVFSCSLSAEEETALSIIDPMSLLLELNNNPVEQDKKIGTSSGGLLDVASYIDRLPILEISFQTLTVRLSYNDIRLFSAIISSMPQQLIKAANNKTHSHLSKDSKNNLQMQMITKLQDLGFSSSDAEKALTVCRGQLDEAAEWLTTHVATVPVSSHGKQSRFSISGFEVKEGSLSVCLIDDCLDADVPLAELLFTDAYVLHKFRPHGEGRARFSLHGDYYNRSLSGWEPFIEKWHCDVKWDEYTDRLCLSVSAPPLAILNLNITSTLLELYSLTKTKWTNDYSKTSSDDSEASASAMYNSRRRVPFIPFAIRNETGSDIKFATITSMPTRTSFHSSTLDGDWKTDGDWRHVSSGSELPFLVNEREKIRHKHTHVLKAHQLLLKVDGWTTVAPVSVDKVGIYFRRADPEMSNNGSKEMHETLPARVVFEVTIEGSARKVITVRSAIIIDNELDDAIEIKLDSPSNSSSVSTKSAMLRIEAHKKRPLPLRFIHSTMTARPAGWSLTWCDRPIRWQGVTRNGEVQNSMHSCDTRGAERNSYRFCVCVRRLKFDGDTIVATTPTSLVRMSPDQVTPSTLPCHVITITPPLRIENLLPIDINYIIRFGDALTFDGTVKPGKQSCHVGVDLSQDIQLFITLENFPSCKELVIPAGTMDYRATLCLHDIEQRMLELIVLIKSRLGASLQLTVLASYWLVNKSGLPLIFREEGANQIAAGQFAEHEIARSVMPLLFSFTDKENSYCTMKLGKSVHGPNTSPHWCSRFRLARGITVSQVHVGQPSRPDFVYNIGIEVRVGRGRYSDTNIVTFTPRYQLDNRSSHKLAYTQRHLAKTLTTNDFLTALPGCVLPFHWPRVDLDTLLCIRLMDRPTSAWSGGFLINAIDSFHINMRDENNRCLFLRVDVVLEGATYVVVFTDADQMPPPYRIDNFAEVQVMFYQAKVSNERLRTYIKPHTSMPYAWDEPTLLPHITLKVPSGTGATYDMNVTGDGEKLCYENFIYIAFTHTFKKKSAAAASLSSSTQPTMIDYQAFVESQELVLDVCSPTMTVQLKKKEPGKRSQLWRMSSNGMLTHEGSSVPRDPRNPGYTSSVVYVLDIKDIALQPNRDMQLALRKPDDRRRSTQIWKFIDGQLCCGGEKTKLFVQAKDGMFGLRDGGEVMLGPVARHLSSSHAIGAPPPETAIDRQKLQPGSGFLVVKVLTDGPTRVLQITDVNQQRYEGKQCDDWYVVEETGQRPVLKSEKADVGVISPTSELSVTGWKNLEVSINLPAGVGISLVDSTPEEIIYVTLRNLHVEYNFTNSEQMLQIDVKRFQVDNQMFGCYKPTLLFLTQPHSGADSFDSDPTPALHIRIHKMPHHNWNAEIFKQLMVHLKPVTLLVEEIVLWKLLKFVGLNQREPDVELDLDESHIGSNRAVSAASSTHFKRFYFGMIKINKCQVSLSMLTASEQLPTDLLSIKRYLRYRLIRFEDAKVELDPFIKHHVFETSAFLLESMRQHYTHELMSQAAKILGSVDFLGNPLGLFSDVTEGVSGLLEGNLRGLLENVTHGVSNSAAKVTGSLSDTVGSVTLDKSHQQERRRIINQNRDGGTDHLVAGFKGLWHGVKGGLTSIPMQTISGAREDGVQGFMSGFARGVIGTVTKPVAGLLDLTSGTANAIRDTSKGLYHWRPQRLRKPRCCYGPGGLLPSYCEENAQAQELLFVINKNRYSERFIALDKLQADEGLQALISSERLYCMILNRDLVWSKDHTILLCVHYKELLGCQWIQQDSKFYLQLTTKADADSAGYSDVAKKRPLVKCDTEALAIEVVQHIIYAKNLFDESQQTLAPGEQDSADRDLTPQ